MPKLISVLFSLFILGAVHAAEIADAPIPEPNYVGILVFLALMVGGGVWFFWRVMSKGSKDKQDEAK